MNRYFTHTDCFYDQTAYLYSKDDRIISVFKDGSEHSSEWELKDCLGFVRWGGWKEITQAEAEGLIVH